MKTLRITAVCTATVEEDWTIEVPDDFDPAAHEGGDLIGAALAVSGNSDCQTDVSNEQESKITEWYEVPA